MKNTVWIIICPECESDDIRKDGNTLVCDKCGNVWLENSYDE